MLFKRLIVSTTAIAAIGAGAVVVASPAGADPSVAGTYNATGGVRIVDTRSGVGLPKAQLGAGQTATFDVTPTLNAAADDAPLNLGVTVVNSTQRGYLTVFPGGDERPGTSTMNFVARQNMSNTAFVESSDTGTVSVYNSSSAPVDLVIDLNGYWTSGDASSESGGFTAVTPTRTTDTRVGDGATPVPANSSRTVNVLGTGGVPDSGVSAVAFNLTATDPTASGYLSATPQPESGSRTAAVNFAPGVARADLAVVEPNTDGTITVFNGSTKPIDFAVDVAGYFTDGTPADDGAYVTTTQYRGYDSRTTSSPVAANSTRKVPLFQNDGSAAIFKSVVVTVAAVGTRSFGHLVAWNGNGSLPPISSVNYVAGQNVAQALVVPVNSDGSISIRNESPGTTNLIVDVSGFVLNADSDQAVSASRIHAALSSARRHAALATR